MTDHTLTVTACELQDAHDLRTTGGRLLRATRPTYEVTAQGGGVRLSWTASDPVLPGTTVPITIGDPA